MDNQPNISPAPEYPAPPSTDGIPPGEATLWKTARSIFMVVLIIVVLAAAYGAFAYLQGVWPFEQEIPVAEQTDILQGWQEYTHPTQGYQIAVPPEYTISVPDEGPIRFFVDPDFAEGWIEILWGDARYEDGKLLWPLGQTEIGIIDPPQTMTVGGVQAERWDYVYCDGPGCGFQATVLVLPAGGTNLQIIIRQPGLDELRRQILSTFRFTEADPTADWKSFRHDTFGIALQYPPTSPSESPCHGIPWTVTEQENPFSSSGGLVYFGWIGVAPETPPTLPGCGDEHGGGEAFPLQIYEGRTLESVITDITNAFGVDHETSTIDIVGVPATQLDLTGTSSAYRDRIVIISGNGRIHVLGAGGSRSLIDSGLFDNIVSKFRFTP